MFVLYMLIGLIVKILGWFLIMSVALLFDKKKTTKSIILVSIVALFIGAIVEIPGALNGKLISFALATGLFINSLLSNLIPLLICVTIITCTRVYTKKWYTKILPWVVGILYGTVLIITTPLIIREQIKLYKESKQVEVITMGTQLDTMIKQQNEIQNQYFDLCGASVSHEYPKLAPNEQTKICACFAEKMAQFIYSGDEQEFNRYQTLDTYKIKIWNRELEKCHKELNL